MKYYHPVAFLEVYCGENCHSLKFCCYFIHRMCMVGFPLSGFIQVPRIQTNPHFLLSLVHVLQACVQVSGEICTVPLENALYLQSNQNSVTECLASSMGVCSQVLPLCRCLMFLNANDSPGLQTCFIDLWTYAQCAGGPLHEVFLCTCTGSTCIAVIAGVEGVVVLKGVSICAVFVVGAVSGTLLELY